jgi:NADH dehydrogenase [ubiquinone] 1 alpha subcomplex assembly factor 1
MVHMKYLRYPAVKVTLAVCIGALPLAWLADGLSFEGPRPEVGPWTLLVLMSGPLLFSAALSLAVLHLPAVDTASLRPILVGASGLMLFFSSNVKAADKPSMTRTNLITGFDAKDGLDWKVVNDGVMGGLSEGKLTPNQDGTVMFNGMLSLENNGGFSSFRSGAVNLDLSSHRGLLLRVKGDGRKYQVRLATDALFRGMEVSFSAEFATIKDQWIEVKVPFDSFKGSFRGLDLPQERLDASKVRRLGILLGDKKQGPFALELDFIHSYNETAPNT